MRGRLEPETLKGEERGGKRRALTRARIFRKPSLPGSGAEQTPFREHCWRREPTHRRQPVHQSREQLRHGVTGLIGENSRLSGESLQRITAENRGNRIGSNRAILSRAHPRGHDSAQNLADCFVFKIVEEPHTAC